MPREASTAECLCHHFYFLFGDRVSLKCPSVVSKSLCSSDSSWMWILQPQAWFSEIIGLLCQVRPWAFYASQTMKKWKRKKKKNANIDQRRQVIKADRATQIASNLKTLIIDDISSHSPTCWYILPQTTKLKIQIDFFFKMLKFKPRALETLPTYITTGNTPAPNQNFNFLIR